MGDLETANVRLEMFSTYTELHIKDIREEITLDTQYISIDSPHSWPRDIHYNQTLYLYSYIATQTYYKVAILY